MRLKVHALLYFSNLEIQYCIPKTHNFTFPSRGIFPKSCLTFTETVYFPQRTGAVWLLEGVATTNNLARVLNATLRTFMNTPACSQLLAHRAVSPGTSSPPKTEQRRRAGRRCDSCERGASGSVPGVPKVQYYTGTTVYARRQPCLTTRTGRARKWVPRCLRPPTQVYCHTAIMYDGLEVSILSSNAALHSTQVSPMGLPMRFEIRSQVTVL